MERVDLLREAADVLAGLDPDTLTDDELGEALVEWHRLDARLAASKARLTAAFDARRAWAADGSKTAAAWLARRTNGSPGAMRAQTRLARRLRHMPATAAALAAGVISERHAEVLAGLWASPRPVVADAFGDAEAHLVDYAQSLGFDEFLVAVRYWEAVVDQDGVEEQAGADHAARHLHLSQTFRGTWVLDGQLDPTLGEQVYAELRRIEDELFTADWDAALAAGDGARADRLARTPAQRRADALVVMAQRSSGRRAGDKEPKPLLVVHVGDDSLKRICELASGTVIAPGQVVPLLGDAEIERIVYTGPSRRIVDLGRRSRFFTGALRRAIQLRDRRCTHPGCTMPAEDCDIDHIHPYAKGGCTNQDNGECKCGHHNRHKADTVLGPSGSDSARRSGDP